MPDANLLRAGGKLELSDVVKYLYFHTLVRTWYLTIFFILMLLFCVFGFVAVLSTGDSERLRNPGTSYLIMFIFVSLQFFLPYIVARRQISKLPYFREPMRYQFADDRIRLEGASFSSEITWPLVKRVYETKNAFLIYHSAPTAWIIPKRFFWGNDSEIQHWRKFVVGRLAKPRMFHAPEFPATWL